MHVKLQIFNHGRLIHENIPKMEPLKAFRLPHHHCCGKPCGNLSELCGNFLWNFCGNPIEQNWAGTPPPLSVTQSDPQPAGFALSLPAWRTVQRCQNSSQRDPAARMGGWMDGSKSDPRIINLWGSRLSGGRLCNQSKTASVPTSF